MNKLRSYRWVGGLVAAVAAAAGVTAVWVRAAGRNDYIGRAASSPLFVKCGLIAAGCVAVLIGLIAVLVITGRPGRRGRPSGLAAGDDGTAMAEFALLFPVALSLVLVLTQAMLMMAGAMVVNYAAYAAARSAIVYVPQDLPATGIWSAEGENQVADPTFSQKCYWIKMAAAVACMPVAGTSNEADPTNGEMHNGIAQYYKSNGVDPPPGWVDNFVTGQISYAWNHTTVQLWDVVLQAPVPLPKPPNPLYGPADDVTVYVAHDFRLAIPFADRLFQDGNIPGVGYTLTIKAQCTLNNEGVSDTIQLSP